VLRIAAAQALALQIGRLDLLDARVPVEPVDAPVDVNRCARRNPRRRRDFVSCAVRRDALQRLMPAMPSSRRAEEAVGEMLPESMTVSTRVHGDAAFFQGDCDLPNKSTFVCFCHYITAAGKKICADKKSLRSGMVCYNNLIKPKEFLKVSFRSFIK
jgi:hypothetical protein